MARRTLILSNGGIFWFMTTNCAALSIGVAKTLTLPCPRRLAVGAGRTRLRTAGAGRRGGGAPPRGGGRGAPRGALRFRQRSGFPTLNTYDAVGVRFSFHVLKSSSPCPLSHFRS